MRATLQQPAPDSYSGQWTPAFPKESGARIGFHCPE